MSMDFTVEREKEDIDLLIQDENNYIIIENKIKSGINGIKKSSDKEHNSQEFIAIHTNSSTLDTGGKIEIRGCASTVQIK